VAGSQFNGEVVQGSDDLRYLLKKSLPATLQFDQFNRAEITLDFKMEQPLGWSGVKSIEEVRTSFPDAQFEKTARIPGGEEAVEEGIEGAWYPETARTSDGGFEVVKDEEGKIKNPHAKFEPKANIVNIPKDRFRDICKTEKITLIIQKDNQSNRPVVLTIFPGDNAPAYPAKISTESYKATSLGDTKEMKFWSKYAFIKGV
jgi:hypothetical protein